MGGWSSRINRVVRLIHVPTGITAEVDNERSQHRNRLAALHLLTARLWASQNMSPVGNIVADYNLPDNVPYPHNLEEYRSLGQAPDDREIVA
jgi:peptide chain release factor 2